MRYFAASRQLASSGFEGSRCPVAPRSTTARSGRTPVSAGVALRGYVHRSAWLACVAAAVAGAQAQAPPPPAAVPLREGQPQTATHAAEDHFRYDVEIGAGTY